MKTIAVGSDSVEEREKKDVQSKREKQGDLKIKLAAGIRSRLRHLNLIHKGRRVKHKMLKIRTEEEKKRKIKNTNR